MAAWQKNKENSLLRGSLGLVWSNAVFVLCSYLILVLIARKTDPASFGRYTVAVSVLTWVEILTAQSFRPRVMHEAASGRDTAVKALLTHQLVWSIAACAALILLCRILADLLGDPLLASLIRASAIDVVPFSLLISQHAMLHGGNRYAWLALSRCLYAVAKLIFMGGCLMVLDDLAWAFVGMALASSTTAFIAFWCTRTLPPDCRSASLSLPPYQAAPQHRWALLFVAAEGLLLEADMWLVKASSFNANAVGLYAAARNTARIIIWGGHGLTAPLLPAVIASGGLRAALKTHKDLRVLAVMLALGLAGSALLGSAFAPQVLALLFGMEYRPGSGYLLALLPAAALWVIALCAVTILFHSGRPQAAAILTALAAAAFFVAGSLSGPRHGPAGVAWALSFSLALLLCSSCLTGRWKAGTK